MMFDSYDKCDDQIYPSTLKEPKKYLINLSEINSIIIKFRH